ncbi:MAG TPA: PaaI family thioesterase, partial [Thermoleophilaceae bacterium]
MRGRLPGLFGVELIAIEHGAAETSLEVRGDFLAPNDYLHAGAVVTLADTTCGMGCLASLPEGASGFTTAELKVNFLRSTGDGDTLS